MANSRGAILIQPRSNSGKEHHEEPTTVKPHDCIQCKRCGASEHVAAHDVKEVVMSPVHSADTATGEEGEYDAQSEPPWLSEEYGAAKACTCTSVAAWEGSMLVLFGAGQGFGTLDSSRANGQVPGGIWFRCCKVWA